MNFAVLGLGSIGIRHARNLIDMDIKVFGYDPSEKRRILLTELGGETVVEHKELPEGLDAIVIASPNEFHLQDFKFAIDQGCHVFIEKPLSHEIHNTKDIVDKADEKKLVCFVGQSLRFNPAVTQVKNWLDEKKIGKLVWSRLICSSYLPEWRKDQDYRVGYTNNLNSGGVIFDCIHEIDLANYLFGPAEVIASAARKSDFLEIDVEDIADIILKHDSGINSSIHIDYVTRPKKRITEIAGINGFIEMDISNRKARLSDVSGNIIDEINYDTNVGEDYIKEIQSFINCIKKPEEPSCNGHEALHILKQAIDARKLAGLN